jgi:hypothetical protein
MAITQWKLMGSSLWEHHVSFLMDESIELLVDHFPYYNLDYLDLLIRGSQTKNTYSLNRFPSHGGLKPLGKYAKSPTKQTHDKGYGHVTPSRQLT